VGYKKAILLQLLPECPGYRADVINRVHITGMHKGKEIIHPIGSSLVVLHQGAYLRGRHIFKVFVHVGIIAYG
jgi:hypothetical protein